MFLVAKLVKFKTKIINHKYLKKKERNTDAAFKDALI